MKRLVVQNGTRFGRLEVIEEAPTRKDRRYFLCKCDCGDLKEYYLHNLIRELTTSCGCLKHEQWTHLITKHGWSGKGSPNNEHQIWCEMIRRCYYSKDSAYIHYGGRGIQVCESWKESFVSFISDLGPRPSKEHSIDRIDNNGNYEPGNCRWATRKQQRRNRDDLHLITIDGTTKCLTEWAEQVGLKPGTVKERIRRGWPDEVAVTTPIRPSRWGSGG